MLYCNTVGRDYCDHVIPDDITQTDSLVLAVTIQIQYETLIFLFHSKVM